MKVFTLDVYINLFNKTQIQVLLVKSLFYTYKQLFLEATCLLVHCIGKINHFKWKLVAMVTKMIDIEKKCLDVRMFYKISMYTIHKK